MDGSGRPTWFGEESQKHGVSFELAEAVLRDDEGDVYHVDERDDDHSEEEDRYTTFGSFPANRSLVLRITWTRRDGKCTRIISARQASKKEMKDYAQKISGQ